MITLVLGGARSGKSEYAENLLKDANSISYIATCESADTSMAQRIELHQQRRPAHWQTCEASLHLAQAIEQVTPDQAILVDCLSVWLSNVLYRQPDELTAYQTALSKALAKARQQQQAVVLVSGEVGSGLFPMDKVARRFVDELGWLNQRIAAQADTVVLVTAGLPMTLKQPS